jgi:hypothetical protein
VSADPDAAPGGWDPTSTADAAGGSQAPGEEELRRAYEAELSRITTTDMMAQTAISLLNLGARRLGLAPPGPQAQGADAGSTQAGPGGTDAAAGRDLEQVRDAIDGVRALMGILERRIAGELGPLRDALSQLQMAYAREVQGAGSEQGQGGGGRGGSGAPDGGTSGQGGPPGAEQAPPAGRGPGPAESSGRLWVPGR